MSEDKVSYTPPSPDGSDRIQVVDLAENRLVLLIGNDNQARMFVSNAQKNLTVAILRRVANTIEKGGITDVSGN